MMRKAKWCGCTLRMQLKIYIKIKYLQNTGDTMPVVANYGKAMLLRAHHKPIATTTVVMAIKCRKTFDTRPIH